jgi:hypothetical protein
MLSYLVKVMQAMEFPVTFINWILMLHEGATTRFILKFLTDPIKVLFSIRLLMMMRRMTRGLTVSLVQQKDEDFCDDVNFIGERECDLIVIDEVFSNFEDISGAILSRSEKSKVMGLGPWKGRQDWPLSWLVVI